MTCRYHGPAHCPTCRIDLAWRRRVQAAWPGCCPDECPEGVTLETLPIESRAGVAYPKGCRSCQEKAREAKRADRD